MSGLATAALWVLAGSAAGCAACLAAVVGLLAKQLVMAEATTQAAREVLEQHQRIAAQYEAGRAQLDSVAASHADISDRLSKAVAALQAATAGGGAAWPRH